MTLLLVLVLFNAAGPADTLEAFKGRIADALAHSDEAERRAALGALYHTPGMDEQTTGYYERALVMLAGREGAAISFEALGDMEFMYVLNGSRYMPNLEPVGMVKLEGGAERGGSTQLPYALHEGRFVFPATVRDVLDPNAPPDITLQIIAIGMGHPPLTFDGWCDVRLSDGSTKRQTVTNVEGAGNSTLMFHGQFFERCEVRNTSGRGALSLRLIEADDTMFERRVEAPEAVITYYRPF